MSVVVTAIFNATGGSLLPIILLHGAMNTWPDRFAPAGSSTGMTSIGIAPMVLLAIVVALVCGPAYFPRKPGAVLPADEQGKGQA
jgi:membrane protease YdiL (CAAX protease family)